jgi:hypothetical protein
VLARAARVGDGFIPLQEESVVDYERWDGGVGADSGDRDGREEESVMRREDSQLVADEPSVYRNDAS